MDNFEPVRMDRFLKKNSIMTGKNSYYIRLKVKAECLNQAANNDCKSLFIRKIQKQCWQAETD